MATELDRGVVALNLLSLLEYEELWPLEQCSGLGSRDAADRVALHDDL